MKWIHSILLTICLLAIILQGFNIGLLKSHLDALAQAHENIQYQVDILSESKTDAISKGK